MANRFDEYLERRGTGSMKWSEPLLPAHARRGGAGSPVSDPGTMIPMWLADMDFPTAPPVIDALARRVQHGVFGYASAGDDYFRAIIGWHERRHGWDVDRDWIIPTSGSVPAINVALQTLTRPGDGVIVQPPVFHPFAQSIENNARRVVPNALVLDGGRYRMDFDDLARKAADPRVRMLILCSPHNPVGRVWSEEELRTLGRICSDCDVIVVSDEVHCDLAMPGSRFTTCAVADPVIASRLVHCHGPSKTFNLPGLKVSTTIIPDERLRNHFLTGLRNLNELFGVSVLGTVALQAAYDKGEDWLTELLDYLDGNARLVDEYLDANLPQVRRIRADATYFAWLDCRDLGPLAVDLKQRLQDRARVWLEDGATYGAEGAGFLRMNIACPRTLLAAALERISAALR